jgi:hypothetical protein
MPSLVDLITEYCELLEREREIAEEKERLRQLIQNAMERERLEFANSQAGSARRVPRYRLRPRREEVLNLLGADDLFPFASFPPAKVKLVLVPKFGRERLIPLFDIEKKDTLIIKRSSDLSREPISGGDYDDAMPPDQDVTDA